MRKTKPWVFFVIALLIFGFSYTAIYGVTTWYGSTQNVVVKGVSQIRWGIDIKGGVEAAFVPANGVKATSAQMNAVETIIKSRLVSKNITDYEVYTDTVKDRVIVRFPWASNEANFDPQQSIKELGATAVLTFREGASYDQTTGMPTGITASSILLSGNDVKSAVVQYNQTSGKPVVLLTFNASGKTKFAAATTRLVGQQISIWMDNALISAPSVNDAITDGAGTIESSAFTQATALDLANKINSGALPFSIQADNVNTISPSLGQNSLTAMVVAGLIAFGIICIFMIVNYRLPGIISCIALIGHTALMFAFISGYFPGAPSFTLTLPGIAGVILSLGIAVDANVINAERIKEELRYGRSLDLSLKNGYSHAFSAIFDGNIAITIVAVVLMGTFGPTNSLFSIMLSPFLSWLGVAVEGTVYSFGYTLLIGVVLNLFLNVFVSRIMTYSISRMKPLRKNWLYGGKK